MIQKTLKLLYLFDFYARIAWIIHESRLLELRGVNHEAVVVPPQMVRNKADAVRSARSKSKKWRLKWKKD